MRIPRILALVLAGGKGSRLDSLTHDQPKPALPIGGTYTLIDVALSNLAHSHIKDVWMVEQFQPHKLNLYIDNGRPWDLDRTHGGLVVTPPFEGGNGEGFAQGNADSLARQLDAMRAFDPEHVLVLSADHLYTLNFLDVYDTHLQHEADLTMVTTHQAGDVSRYGVVEIGSDRRITDFAYKPEGATDSYVATEIFLYRAPALFDALEELQERTGQLSDYGDELLPHFLQNHTVVSHDLGGYWMDLGTLQSYWAANLQLIDGDSLDLDREDWRLWSAQPQRLPARLGETAEVARAMVSAGSAVDGAVVHSVIGIDCRVEAGAEVRDSVLLDGAVVEQGVRLRNCIVVPGARVAAGPDRGAEGVVTLIGHDGTIDARVPFDHGSPLPSLS
ncbi:glucose-1-phosphate adenylyltransferase family protein [Brevibacterium ihuae]|uniref:glucose-1-phosphate adenylyltransferase family protein n=1 Tax=Brevibacterium ihuae TaxID=1631743 RepID=UPI000C76FA96|nr:sugar phosphate nucleotidyltransferase [Brevibacterium ihuae]